MAFFGLFGSKNDDDQNQDDVTDNMYQADQVDPDEDDEDINTSSEDSGYIDLSQDSTRNSDEEEDVDPEDEYYENRDAPSTILGQPS